MTPSDNLEAGAGDLVKPKGAGDGSLERQYREAAAQLAAVTAENARLREALEPFVMEGWADNSGWTDRGCPNDRICDWFGPSDFARAALSQEAPK